MTELFRTSRNNITIHIGNIFTEGELEENSVCKDSLRTAAVGTRFRQWANTVMPSSNSIDFIIRTSTPPAEMLFFEGDFYTARVALENLVHMAAKQVVVIDAYISVLTLDSLSVRSTGVETIIYTTGIGKVCNA